MIRTFILPTETFVMNQINRLDYNQKVSSQVLCSDKKENKFKYSFDAIKISELLSLLAQKIDSISYHFFRLLSPFSSYGIKKYIKFKNIQLIHIHYLVDARYYLNAYKNVDVPKIVSCYGYDVSSFPKKYNGLAKLYLKPVFKYINIFLAMSDDMKDDLIKIGCPPDKIIVHYHGINVSRFLNIKRDYIIKGKATILIVASLVEKKGHKYLINSIKNYKDEVELRIAGDGPLRDELLDHIKNNNIKTSIVFLGHINNDSHDIIKEYTNADIFIHPSIISSTGDKEGIPGSLVEAMASGLPTISTYHAGIPNAIEHNKNGMLIKEKDTSDLNKCISKVINDKSFRTNIGINARNFANSNLNYKNKTNDLEKIYRLAINKRKL